jgi:hypothetical protein
VVPRSSCRSTPSPRSRRSIFRWRLGRPRSYTGGHHDLSGDRRSIAR